MNWVDYMMNHRAIVLKQYMAQILQNRYLQNESIIDKITSNIKSDKESADFNKFIIDIYETAYLKAVDDHKEQLSKLGLKANIVPGANEKQVGSQK